MAGVIIFAGVACNKYEEGPGVSFRSRKGRVANTWEVEKYIASDGTESTPDPNDDTQVTYDKDGSYTVSSASSGFSLTGTWEFNDDKTRIYTSYEFGGDTYKDTSGVITKLKNKEMWTKDDDNSEVHLKAVE